MFDVWRLTHWIYKNHGGEGRWCNCQKSGLVRGHDSAIVVGIPKKNKNVPNGHIRKQASATVGELHVPTGGGCFVTAGANGWEVCAAGGCMPVGAT